MKTSKKILILIAAILTVASLCTACSGSAPEIADVDPDERSVFDDGQIYVVGKAPYMDSIVFDTRLGVNTYWKQNHNGGKAMELVLQVTKDDKLVVLSDDLPARSNASYLLGKDASVATTPLDKLQKINLFYDIQDENGDYAYREYTGDNLRDITVLSLEDCIDVFKAPERVIALMYFRFKDEAGLKDPQAMIEQYRDAIQDTDLVSHAVLCLESEKNAKYFDENCAGLNRSATANEAESLYADSRKNRDAGALPYILVFADADSPMASEAFIQYAHQYGLAVVVEDATTENAVDLRDLGVDAMTSSKPAEVIQVLRDARLADREKKKAAN